MKIVKAVTACVDMGLSLRSLEHTHALGRRLLDACAGRSVFYECPYAQVWTVQELPGFMPANTRAEDRFATAVEHQRSNYVQHMPVQMLARAYEKFPEVDVFVWLGYTLLKQGNFTGKLITEEHVSAFLDKLAVYPFDDIPFPGITPERRPVDPYGDNWRFCGSTIIAPRRFLPGIVRSYKFETREFVRRHRCVPLDLAIWPTVEARSGLPWRFYPAEYDATQLTNLPG